MNFGKYIEPVAQMFKSKGIEAFHDEHHIATYIISSLEALIQADQPSASLNPNSEPVSVTGAISTQAEAEDLGYVIRALEAEALQQSRMLKDVSVHLVDALNFLADIKMLASTGVDIPRGFSDSIWRVTDLAQTRIENALGQIAPEELSAVHDTRS
jgi:hypothetical protein